MAHILPENAADLDVQSRLPYVVHSSDCHVIEPPDLWSTRVDALWRDRAPRVVRYDDTELWVVDDGKRMAVVGIQAQAGHRYEDPDKITKRGFYTDIPEMTPERYIAGLDMDGVVGAVMFSSNAHQAYRVVAGELLSQIARAFNDWLLEYCSAAPDRLKGIPMINIDDLDEATAEMERTARAGAAGLMIPIQPLPGRRYDQPQYDRIWAAAVDLGLPIVFHVGANQAVVGREPMIDLVRHGMKDLHVRAAISTMVLSGVFTRFPELRVGVVEFEGSWAPYLIDQLDELYTSGKAKRCAQLPAGELPSDHFRRNVFVSFQDDSDCIALREFIGVDNLCWGSDYPHAEATFPRSHAILAEHLKGVPSDEASRIVGANTARLFGLR